MGTTLEDLPTNIGGTALTPAGWDAGKHGTESRQELPPR